MLCLLEGAFNSDVRDGLKRRIGDDVKNKKNCFLIVPEQQTVIAEAELATELDASAPLYLEVTNFTRFANTVFRKLGGIQKQYINGVKKSLVMWRTLTELAPLLSFIPIKKDATAGTVDRVLAAVKEAEALGLDAAALAELANDGALDSRLRGKLSDLSLVLGAYKKHINEKYADSADDCAALAKKIKENGDFLKNTDIFIEGFTSFTAPQYTLIEELIAGCDVTVLLNIPKNDPSSFEYTELKETASKLVSICDKKCADKKIFKFDGRKNIKSDLLFEIYPLLWKSNSRIETDAMTLGGDLRIFEAEDPYEECEFIASDIKRRVMAGASYRDFAIVGESISDYDGILDTGLDKAEIPHFSSVKTELRSFEAVKLIFTAIAATRSFSRADVLAYAACGLSGITRDEYDEFELYTDKWQISGRGFTDANVWNMNPLGFESKRLPDEDTVLSRINATRVKLISPLAAFAAELSDAETVRDHATATVHFLESIGLESSLKKRARRLSEIGESSAANDNLRLYTIICDALDTAVEVLGDTVTGRDSFLSQLKVIFSSYEIGRIPASADEVTVGNAGMLRLGEKKHIYLIGVNYGKFPASPSDSSYFSDKERRSLSMIGIETGVSDTEGAHALFSFTRAFASASESVTLLYPRSDSSFGALSPSYVIENIHQITDGAIKTVKIGDVPIRDKFFVPLIAAESLSECTESERRQVIEALVRDGNISFGFGDSTVSNGSLALHVQQDVGKELSLTQTRIDTFISCPLKYFCQFTLSFNSCERARFGANNIGSYIHAILENFFFAVKRDSLSPAELDGEKRAELLKKAAQAYLDGFANELGSSSMRMRSALSKIYRAARPIVDDICNELLTSGFRPKFFELPISRIYPSAPSPVEITGEGGERIAVYGTIDRVDTYELNGDIYVRVVDYKTGAKDFRPEELSEGKNLQMFLYLKSVIESEKESFNRELGLKEGGKARPAGLIYIHTNIGDKRVRSATEAAAVQAKPQKRTGMVLLDDAIMSAMGTDFLPVKLTKSGIHKSYEKFVFTEDGWYEISELVESTVGRIGHRIAAGDIGAAKYADKKGPCEYCRYKAFCRSAR